MTAGGKLVVGYFFEELEFISFKRKEMAFPVGRVTAHGCSCVLGKKRESSQVKVSH